MCLRCCVFNLFFGDEQECYNISSLVLERDPYCVEVLPLRLASGLELGKKNQLFLRAHRSVECS